MRSKLFTFRRLFLYTLLLGSLATISINFYRSTYKSGIVFYPETNNSLCLKWESADRIQRRPPNCLPNERILSTVWTHDGTGLMKYIQWIVTRKLGNVRILQLNDDCEIIHENSFFSNPKNDMFVQIFIVSLASNFNDKSQCSTNLEEIIKFGMGKSNQIYFKRKSIRATVGYQYLDTMRYRHNGTFNRNISSRATLEKATFLTQRFINYFKTTGKTKSVIMDSEDLIHVDLIQCEKMLRDFILLLQLDTTAQILKDIIEYDSYQFIEDAIWWDQTETIERILSKSLPSIPQSFTYSRDFYHFYANHSFTKYISDSRQCYRNGVFPQMQHETITNRSSTDKPERCSQKQFDCAFSDIYSFSDREHLYQPYPTDAYFNQNTIRCGFAVSSVFDKVRQRYGRNHTCETIVFTCITNCYDPVPIVQDAVPPNVCFVALLDTNTANAFKVHYPSGHRSPGSKAQWEFFDLGKIGSIFRVAAKATETLKIVGHRMFPVAKWIVWLDGKAFIINIKEVLSLARSPVVGLHHSDFTRTSAKEVNLTLNRVRDGEVANSLRLNTTLQEIYLQEAEYTRDGFYNRSDMLGLPLFDIAIFTYRNNHPCAYRYLCGWHNEINYFSYRGQLSVYYSAERLNVTDYLTFIPRRLYHTMAHNKMC